MDKLKTVGVGALVALVVALVVTYFNAPGAQIVREVVREVTQQLGAVPTLTDVSNGPICIEGYCEWPKSGVCADATTSLVQILNPFGGATATVAYTSVNGYVGTSSLLLMMGTSTAQVGANNFPSGVSATNTLATSTNYVRIGPFRDSYGLNAYVSGSGSAEVVATGSPAIIGPNQYFTITATGTNGSGDSNGGLLGGANLFTCNYAVKFVK